MILNAVYMDLAYWMNDYENHRSDSDYDSALTAKVLC